jgi:carboxymethylenebutenolidase
MLRNETRNVSVDDGTDLGLYFVHPDGEARGAVIVLQEIFGVNAHIKEVCEKLAREGYVAVAPDLFHRTGPWWTGEYTDFAAGVERAQKTTQDNIRADLRATHAAVATNKVAAVGFCMGGRQAYVANGILPLRCAVSFYGGNLVGLPELAKTQSGPLLTLWGGRDRMIDVTQRRAVADMLAHHAHVDITFNDADHGFFCDHRKSFHAAAAAQAWPLVTAFLASYVS